MIAPKELLVWLAARGIDTMRVPAWDGLTIRSHPGGSIVRWRYFTDPLTPTPDGKELETGPWQSAVFPEPWTGGDYPPREDQT